MNFAILTRMSFEVKAGTREDDGLHEQMISEAGGERHPKPMTGREILGRDEQERDCQKFVMSRGGHVVYTYEEPDTSAFKRRRVRMPDGSTKYRVVRPVYEQMLSDLKRGTAPNGKRLDGIAVYDIDRLTRDNRDLEDAIEVVEHFGRPIIDTSGTLDLLTDNGRSMARVVVTMANKQSADTRRRVKNKHKALQREGIPMGGKRPFGWRDDKRTLNSPEAKELAYAVERLLQGSSINAVVANMNRRGVVTVYGKAMTARSLMWMLRNPRICGIRSRVASEIDPSTGREHRTVEIVYGDDGQPVKGQWTPIITVEEWQALTEIIRPNPDKDPAGHNARKYLSSGILRCDKNGCGMRLRSLVAGKSKKKPPGYYFYICGSKTDGRGCGGVKLPGPETDAVIKELVIAKYEVESRENKAQKVPESWDKQADLDAVEEDIAAAHSAREQRMISAEMFISLLAKYEPVLRRLKAEHSKWLRAQRRATAKRVDLRADWDGLSLTEQRAYLEEAFAAILVKPAEYRRQPLKERLTPIPR